MKAWPAAAWFISLASLVYVKTFADPTPPGSMPADSLAAFRPDSANLSSIRDVEAGKTGQRPQRSQTKKATLDSLEHKLEHRHISIGISLGISFTQHSAQALFANHLDSVATRDSQQILQPYDPVDLFYPVGLMVVVPVFRHIDMWLRTDQFWYSQSALTQGTGAAQEFWYAVQAQMAGIGARYLIPVSLLSVSGYPGLYLAYTQFWSFGPTEMYAPTGSVRARMNPGGAGFEIQTGFQQDFGKRWSLTGGLSYADLNFSSPQSWRNILPDAPDVPAHWELRALRLTFQFLYQFRVSKSAPPSSAMVPTPPPPTALPEQK